MRLERRYRWIAVGALVVVVFSFALGVQSVYAQSTPFQAIQALNTTLLRGGQSSTLVQTAMTRQTLLSNYCGQDVTSCLTLMFTSATKKSLPFAVHPYIEDQVMVVGDAEILTVDHVSPAGAIESKRIFIKKVDGSRYEVLSAANLENIQPKTHLRITGYLLGKTLVTSGRTVTYNPLKRSLATSDISGSVEVIAAPPPAPPLTGTIRILVLPFNFWVSSGTFSLSKLAQGMFAPTGASVANYFKTSSGGKLTITGDIYPNYLGIQYPDCKDRCGPHLAEIVTLVNAEALKANVNLSAYDKIVYFSGKKITSCSGGDDWCYVGWGDGGHAYIFGNNSAALLTHEVGHTLSLIHSGTLKCPGRGIAEYSLCEFDAYGEMTDVMGGGDDIAGNFNMNYTLNAPHLIDLGWIDNNHVVDVGSTGTYSVAPAENESTLPRALRIRKSDTNGYYVISYRAQVGRTHIHVWHDNTNGGGGYDGDTKKLLLELTNGASFYDPINNIRVTQQSVTNGVITYAVTLDYHPDLAIADAPLLSGNLLEGSTVRFSTQVKNKGAVASFPADASLVIQDTRSAEKKTYSVSLPVLAPGGQAVVNYSWVAEAGDYTYSICADAQGSVVESDEFNNCSVPIVFSIIPLPDLVPIADSLSPLTIAQDDNVSFTVQMRNVGGPYLPPIVRVLFKVDNGPWEKSLEYQGARFDSNTGSVSVAADAYWRTSAIGSHTVAFMIDPRNEITEKNETNNILTTVVQVLPKTNLVAKNLAVSLSAITEGDIVSFGAQAKNIGFSHDKAFVSRFCMDSDTAEKCFASAGLPQNEIFNASTPSLAFGESESYQTRPWVATSGNHTVYFCTGVNSGLQEDLSDNCISKSFTVAAEASDSVSGKITYTTLTGAAVTDVTVTANDSSGRVIQSVRTDSAGNYSFSNLSASAGPYTFSLSKPPALDDQNPPNVTLLKSTNLISSLITSITLMGNPSAGTPAQRQACDLTSERHSGATSSVDLNDFLALLKFMNTRTPFASGIDWIFTPQTPTTVGNTTTQNYIAILRGDCAGTLYR